MIQNSREIVHDELFSPSIKTGRKMMRTVKKILKQDVDSLSLKRSLRAVRNDEI